VIGSDKSSYQDAKNSESGRNQKATTFRRIVLFLSVCNQLRMFFLWLVFTSNLNNQSTWLKVKLKLVTL